ncbi:MAG TPA: AAA family ATPase, partial [Candidatus Binatia bacterium]|nr:AAA family ATPase [Candidatus Binatia bacterium]
MRCPSCDHDNRADRRFCAECGAALAPVCASCGAANQPGEKFCGGCGARLPTVASAPGAPTPAPDAAVPAGERRQLTVLFCDLVGSTPLSQQLDAEEWRDLIAQYQQAASGAVGRFGGHVARKLGDGLLIYFGWPTAREDDPERAIRAGLAIVDAMGPLNATLAAGDSPRLAVRIGLHTGPVVIADGGEVFGETANVAARVQGAAAPDTVVITAATQRLVTGMFVVEDRGPQMLKGVREPMTLYRVVQPSGVRSRLAGATGRLTRFVGREIELATLVERWGRAHDGEGQTVVVLGEAGVGKSRLVYQFHEHLAAVPHTWLECGATPYTEGTPFHPVIALVAQGLALAPEDTAAEQLGKLESGLGALASPEAVALLAAFLGLPLPTPLQMSPELQRRKTIDLLAQWTLSLSAAQPLVVVVEDLHWCDASTLELLGHVIAQSATARVLLLATARPEFTPPWPAHSHLTTVQLPRLTTRQAGDMVTALGGPALATGTRDALVARADGVPLYIEELTKAVVEPGAARSVAAIPATLADSLMARLDRLSAAKAVAQRAAVLGREFGYPLLATTAGLDEAALRHGLARLIDGEILFARGVPPAATYTFKHALIQETAYESLLKRTRQQLHARVAQVLEERFPERVAAEPEVVAWHAEVAGLAATAVTYYQRAGERAQERSAHEEAITQLRKAIALIETLPTGPERDVREAGVQMALGTTLGAARGYAHAETEAAYERARALCEAAGDSATLASSVLVVLSNLYLNRGEPDRSVMLTERLLAMSDETRDRSFVLFGHTNAAFAKHYQGCFAASLAHTERVIALYDPARDRGGAFHHGFAHNPVVFPLGIAAWNLWYLGHADRSLGRARESVTLARMLGEPYTLACALFFETSVHELRRDWRAQRERAADMIAVGDVQGFPLWRGLGRMFHGVARVNAGEGAAALTEVAEGLALAAGTGNRGGVPGLLASLADGQRAAGRYAEALGAVESGLAVATETGQHFWDAGLHQLKGELLLANDPASSAEAEALFCRALDIARAQEAKSFELRAATSLARLWHRQGKCAEARALLAPVYAWFT